jgi:hypothetical protein
VQPETPHRSWAEWQGTSRASDRARASEVQHRPAPKHTTPCYSPASFGQSGIGRESLAAAAPQERVRARPSPRTVLRLVGRGDAADRPQVRRFPQIPPKPPCFRLQYHQTCKGHPLCRHSPIHFTDIINPSTLPTHRQLNCAYFSPPRLIHFQWKASLGCPAILIAEPLTTVS